MKSSTDRLGIVVISASKLVPIVSPLDVFFKPWNGFKLFGIPGRRSIFHSFTSVGKPTAVGWEMLGEKEYLELVFEGI